MSAPKHWSCPQTYNLGYVPAGVARSFISFNSRNYPVDYFPAARSVSISHSVWRYVFETARQKCENDTCSWPSNVIASVEGVLIEKRVRHENTNAFHSALYRHPWCYSALCMYHRALYLCRKIENFFWRKILLTSPACSRLVAVFCFYTLTSVCVHAFPVRHYWSQANRRGVVDEFSDTVTAVLRN